MRITLGGTYSLKCCITCCKYIQLLGLDLPHPSVEQGKEGEDAQYFAERGGGGRGRGGKKGSDVHMIQFSLRSIYTSEGEGAMDLS